MPRCAASALPIRYVEPVFRPPSEAESLILPVTDGCSWNRCTFCEMYTAPQKAFRARDEAEVIDSIRRTGERYGTQPEYLSTLVVTLHDGGRRFLQAWPDWQALSRQGLFTEMERFLAALELRRTVFRSDHASNWLVLKGTLGADKTKLLAQVRAAIERPASAALRPAWMRGLQATRTPATSHGVNDERGEPTAWSTRPVCASPAARGRCRLIRLRRRARPAGWR